MFQQLHGFSDASTAAYGGVIYLRTAFEDTRVEVTLVTSKSRVAPLKTVTNLELIASLLTAKLLTTITSDLRIQTSSIYAWTYSHCSLLAQETTQPTTNFRIPQSDSDLGFSSSLTVEIRSHVSKPS